MGASPPILCIACSIFRREWEALQKREQLDWEMVFLSSMLHMLPEKLETQLEKHLKNERGRGRILLYGDCCPHMLDLETRSGLARTQGINCCEILLGTKLYHQLRKEGAFFLMPEWALRWRSIFEGELGLKEATARDFMRDMHSRLIYLDTGISPIPWEELAAMSDYSGLPVEVLPVSLEELLAKLRTTAARIQTHD